MKHTCRNCHHWLAEVVDARTGRAMPEVTQAFCTFHGSTTTDDDSCNHHSEMEENDDNH